MEIGKSVLSILVLVLTTLVASGASAFQHDSKASEKTHQSQDKSIHAAKTRQEKKPPKDIHFPAKNRDKYKPGKGWKVD